MIAKELHCNGCGWRTVSGASDLARRLRGAGLFRRAPHPPDDLVLEVLAAHGERLACDRCRRTGLRIVDPRADDPWPDDGEPPRACAVCRAPIPAERLAALPQATRCARCQNADDRGESTSEPDYCPRCGAVLELRLRRGAGLARYELHCTGSPPCRRPR